MPLSLEEKDQALSLAKGMLMAQKDSVSLAGNLVNNPHFTNVPHAVKLEALRQYARLENEGPYRTTVNIEPNRREIAKQVAKAALVEGGLAIPIHGAIAYGLSMRNPSTAADGFLSAKARGLTTTGALAKKLLPVSSLIFAANAAVGGIREGLHQKSKLEEARRANQYLNKIRETSSNEDLNAMLLGAGARQVAAEKVLQKQLKGVDLSATIGSQFGVPVITEQGLMLDSHPYLSDVVSRFDNEYETLNDAYDRMHNIEAYAPKGTEKRASEGIPTFNPMKTPKKYLGGNLRNTKSSLSFKAKSVKIRKEQMKKYDQALKEGLADDSPIRDHLRESNIGRAAIKKFLRL